MQKVPIRSFVLSHAQLILAKTMIRSAELRNKITSKTHDLLEAKVSAALIQSRRQSWPPLHFDQDECRLMRNYNTDYCAVLANTDDEGEMKQREIMRIYRTATQLQLLFSTSKFIQQ